jgi:uncharacterized protein DUF4232
MTHPTPRSRSWLAARAVVAVPAAILIVLAAIAFLRPAPSAVVAVATQPPAPPNAAPARVPSPSSPAPDATRPDPTPSASVSPSRTPTASRPPMTPAPAVASAVTTPICRAKDLSGRILAWDGAAGSRIAEVELQNTAAGPCTIGTPTALRLVAADGTVLIDSSKIGGAAPAVSDQPVATVLAGASIRTDVRVANYCGATPQGPIGVSFSLPAHAGTVVAMPQPGASSDDAVPPCNGPIGPEIEMNGWQS